MLLAQRRRGRRQRALNLLEQVGMIQRARHRIFELSGGEQQRVAIAVALANSPTLLLADEPTGNVDSVGTRQVFETLRNVNRNSRVTVVIVTHDRSVAESVDRVVAIRDGRTSSEFIRHYAEDGDLRQEDEQSIQSTGNASSHQEYVVIDRVGRLQVPQDYLQALSISGRDHVRLALGDDVIFVRRAAKPKNSSDH